MFDRIRLIVLTFGLTGALAACSSSGTSVPQPQQQPAASALRHGLEHLTHATASTRRTMSLGCTLISSVNPNSGYGYLTAKSFDPSDNFTVDGTGCDVALYVGPKAGKKLDHATFNGAPNSTEILIEHTSLDIDHTTITPSTPIGTGIFYTGASGSMDHTTISNTYNEGVVIAGSKVTMDHTTVDNSMPGAGGDGVDMYASDVSIAHTAVNSVPNPDFAPGSPEPADWIYNSGFLFVGATKVDLDAGNSASNFGVGYNSFCSPAIKNVGDFKGQAVQGDTIDYNVDNSKSTCAFTSFYTNGPF